VEGSWLLSSLSSAEWGAVHVCYWPACRRLLSPTGCLALSWRSATPEPEVRWRRSWRRWTAVRRCWVEYQPNSNTERRSIVSRPAPRSTSHRAVSTTHAHLTSISINHSINQSGIFTVIQTTAGYTIETG